MKTNSRRGNGRWFWIGFFITLCGIRLVAANAPAFRWARGAGGIGTDYGSGVAMDSAGNTFVFAKFGANLASLGSMSVSNAEYFLAKYDPDGTPLWVRSVGFSAYAANLPWHYRLGCDAAGNVYIGGGFSSGLLRFGAITLNPLSGFSLFLAKYDATGSLVWATNASGLHPDTSIIGPAFAVAANGSCYLAGSYRRAPDLGLPDALSNGRLGIYVAGFNASGGLDWARGYTGSSLVSFFRSTPIALGLRNDGGLCFAGHFVHPTLSLDSFTLTNRNPSGFSSEIFTVRLAPNGDVLWARSGGSSEDDVARELGVDAAGAIYVSGRNINSPPPGEFQFDSLMLTNHGNFQVKYDADGNVAWLKELVAFEPDGSGALMRVVVDRGGNSTSFGWFSGVARLGEMAVTNSGGTSPFFLARRDEAGTALWAKTFSHGNTGLAYDAARDTEEMELAMNGAGDVVVTGDFTPSGLAFDTFTLTCAGQEDVFLARLDAERPRLDLHPINDWLVLSWPTNWPTFQLEAATNLAAPDSWSAVTNAAVHVGTHFFLTNPIAAGARFFRLRQH